MIRLKNILNILYEASYKYLYRHTPREYIDGSRDVTVNFIEKSPDGTLLYETTTISNNHKHNQWIKPLKGDKLTKLNQEVSLWCDCQNFTYENEYVLWKVKSSELINNNGNPPIIRNVKRVKKLCKHLSAIFDDDIKRRL